MAATDRVGVLLTGRRQALRHRLGVRAARDRGRGGSQPARAGPVRRPPPAPGAADRRSRSTCPALQELCEQLRRRRRRAADRPRPRGPGPRPRGRAAPAFVPDPEIARATFDKYEAHLLLERLGLPSPPTVLPGEPVESLPVMVKPRQGSGARSIHRADDARAAEFFVSYVDEPTMVQKLMDGPEFSIDFLSRPRRPLPERDPADDDRVARRRVDQGHGDRRPRADRARARGCRRRSGCAVRARSRCSATARSASGSPTSTRASAARSRRRCTQRCPGVPTRS